MCRGYLVNGHNIQCGTIPKLNIGKQLTNAPTVDGIPTTDDDAGHQIVLVLVAEPSHQVGRHLDRRHPAGLDGQLAQIVLDVVGQGLGVGRAAGPAAPDAIVELGDLVGDAVGHVRAGGNARVGPEDDPALEGDGDDGRAGGDFAGTEVAGFGRLAVVGVAGGGHVGRCVVVMLVVVVVVREGAHLWRYNQTESGGISGGRTAPKVVEFSVLGWGFDPELRHLRDQLKQELPARTPSSSSCTLHSPSRDVQDTARYPADYSRM